MSPGRPICRRSTVASSRLATTCRFPCGKPAASSPSAIGCVCFLPTRMAISALPQIFRPNSRLNAAFCPPNSTIPGVMMMRRAWNAPSTFTAASAPFGLELNASSMMVMPGDGISCKRCSTGCSLLMPRATCRMVSPRWSATVAASRMFWMLCSPSRRVSHAISSADVCRTNRLPIGETVTSVAHTSASGL